MCESTPANSVTVTGTGTASAAPDSLVLDLRLEGQGSTVAEALDALTRAAEACREALPGVDVRTHGLGVHPRHDYQGNPTGHIAFQSLHVRTDETSAAGRLIQRLSEAVGDALGVNGLLPRVRDVASLRSDARAAAFADARRSADEYAALAGRELGALAWVREGTTGWSPRPEAASGRMMALSSDGPPVDAADHEVVVVVEASWHLN